MFYAQGSQLLAQVDEGGRGPTASHNPQASAMVSQTPLPQNAIPVLAYGAEHSV